MDDGRIRTPGSGSLWGKEGRHFLQSGTLKTSVSYQNATPAFWPSLCVVILACRIELLKLWFSFISNLHNRPGASFRVHQDRRQAGGHSVHITVAREQRGAWLCWRAFSCFPVYSLWVPSPITRWYPLLKHVFLLHSSSLETFTSMCFSVPSR